MALSKNEIDDKFKSAKVGFDSWRKTTIQHRKSILRKYKKLLEANSSPIETNSVPSLPELFCHPIVA